MFVIESVDDIKNKLWENSIQINNFQKSITFPFSEIYKEIVTNIKTTEISSECTLYNSVESTNATKEFSDKDYWNNDIADKEINEYWIIGHNGQGDLWIMDINNKVYFYDHDLEEMSKENFIELGIDFGQWLQFAYLNKELDKIYDEDKYNKEIGKEYMQKLKEISKELMENYPFEME